VLRLASLSMNVLALASYPVEAAATRYRLQQFTGPLAKRGITLNVRPFFDSKLFKSLYNRKALHLTTMRLLKAALLRSKDVIAARNADVVLIQREAMLFGPPLIEWLAARVFRRPMVLDLDDATYVPYTSPTYGGLGKALKWAGKTDKLIRWASIVTCGNRAIADYVTNKGTAARIIPTVVDTEVFQPGPKTQNGLPVLGWVGTHSTFPYLETIFPVFRDLARSHRFKLKIVGAGIKDVNVPGVEVENLEWKLDREIEDFQSIDVGLYPIDSTLYSGNWASGKSGFKAIQYMAVGIPFVASPVGAIEEIGQNGITHLHATTSKEWYEALDRLLSDAKLRRTMGAAGRCHVVEHYSLSDQTEKLAAVLKEAAATRIGNN
jgi:glycosyltransferase involved in cell wall biosynthesis